MRRPFASLVLLAALIPGLLLARSSDRQQPMNVEADRSTYFTDGNSPYELIGNVVITQGTLRINAARADISQTKGEMQRAVLSGSPVTLNQQMDDGTPLTASANKVDYDMIAEVAVFTGNVKLTQPRGSLNGERVVYNMKSGRIESGGGTSRVRMTIQPKTGAATPKAKEGGG